MRRNENYGALDQQLHTLWAACTRNAIMPNLVPILSQAIPLFLSISRSVRCRCSRCALIRLLWMPFARATRSCPAGDSRASVRQSAKHRGAAGGLQLTQCFNKREAGLCAFIHVQGSAFAFSGAFGPCTGRQRSRGVLQRILRRFHRGKASVEACRTAALVCLFLSEKDL